MRAFFFRADFAIPYFIMGLLTLAPGKRADFPVRQSCGAAATGRVSTAPLVARFTSCQARVTKSGNGGMGVLRASLTVARRSSKLLVSTGPAIRSSARGKVKRPFEPGLHVLGEIA